MKTLIIYSSTNGQTYKIAQAMADEIQAPNQAESAVQEIKN